MAKIRGIKADTWTDEKFVEVSPFARLLFIGLWNYVCDNGHIQDKSKQIKLKVLPADDCNVAELLRELDSGGLIDRADGWITIETFRFHQKVDKRWFLTCDKPDCEKPDDETVNVKRKTRRASAETRSGSPRPHGDVDVDVDVDVDGDVTRAIADAIPRGFEDFWTTYDKKRGRKAAIAKYRLALKKPGVTPELLLRAADEYIEWLRGENKHPQFTKDPTAWLNGEHWNDERASSAKPKVEREWWLK